MNTPLFLRNSQDPKRLDVPDIDDYMRSLKVQHTQKLLSMKRYELGLSELAPDLRDADVYKILAARRVAPTESDRLMHLVPYPEGIDVKNPLPEWTRLPLSAKIPFVKAPKDYTVYVRGKLGQSVRRQGETFDLSDPYNYTLQMKYEPIHDKHLRPYFYSPGNKKILEDMGILTKDDQVKCKLSEYNAYRRYVYNVHKNAVMKAIKAEEDIEADKAEARKFLEAAANIRNAQPGIEKREKEALWRAAHRRVLEVCRRMVCDQQLKRMDEVKEKQNKQKELAKLKLFVNQKKFQEQLKEYRVRSQEVNWKRNIRAQNKWKKALNNEENRKCITAEVERISKLYEVIENWIKKEIQQLKLRQRDTIIYKAYKKFSDKRMIQREKKYKQLQLENLRKVEEMKVKGPTPKRILENQKYYKTVGDIYAHVKILPPNINVTGYEKPLIQQLMDKVLVNDKKVLPKKYWGQNRMGSRQMTEFAESILRCIYKRTVKLYLKHEIFRHFPLIQTELKHVVALFEEDMSRKDLTVDEIRRFVRSYVGQRKGDIFHSPEPFTSYGYIGNLKRKLYKSRVPRLCRCDSESDRKPGMVDFNPIITSAFEDKKKVTFPNQYNMEEKMKAVSIKPKSQATKPTVIKSKKKQGGSILKLCPLRSEPDKTDKRGIYLQEKDASCCTLKPKKVCDCTKPTKKVTFNVPQIKSEYENVPSEQDSDKTGGRVAFETKPKIIPIPYDIHLFPLSEELFPNEISLPDKIQLLKRKNLSIPTIPSADSPSVSTLRIKSLQEGKKIISGDMKLQSEDIPTRDDSEFVRRSISKLDQMLTLLIQTSDKETDVKKSSSSSHSRELTIYNEINSKLEEPCKEPASSCGNIHFSSSSSDISHDIEDFIPTEDGEQTGGNTQFDGSKHKCFKNKYAEADVPQAVDCHRNFGILSTDGRKRDTFISNASNCKSFLERKEIKHSKIQREHLKSKFTKYIKEEEKEENKGSKVDINETEGSSDYTNKLVESRAEEDEELNMIMEPTEIHKPQNENGNSDLLESKDKITNEAVISGLNREFSNVNEPQKRGTELRSSSKFSPTPYCLKGEGSQPFGKSYLEQVFEPSYQAKYAPEDDKENIEEIKSILRKTSYSPAENCALVPTYLNQYKFGDMEDLKNFVQLKINIDEQEAIAAVKTRNVLEGLSWKGTKSCYQKDLGKINLDALKQYSRHIVPGGSENYKYISKINTPSAVNEYRMNMYDDLPEMRGMSSLEPNIAKAASSTKLLKQAAPEIKEIYMTYFDRVWPELTAPSGLKDTRKVRKHTHTSTKGKIRDDFRRKPFNTPEDVIEDSRNYKERCFRGEIGFLSGTSCKKKALHVTKTESKNLNNLKTHQMKRGSSVSSEISHCRIPEKHKFTFLQGRLFKADEVRLCPICSVCPISRHGGGETSVEMNVTNLLQCAECGACVHDLMDVTSDNTEPALQRKTALHTADESSSSHEPEPEITFCSDTDLKQHTSKKLAQVLSTYANLKAIFGVDFDPDKFVYFVRDGKDHICWNDLLKRRYPVKPFPWNEIKSKRLEKKKFPINVIKNYECPKNIFRKKVAEGYGSWESAKMAGLESGKEKLTFNKVPKKYEHFFSTTVSPANKPPRTLKPIKDRRPTPMPSVTDIIGHIAEQSDGNMYEAQRMVRHLRVEESIVKGKVDSAVRTLAEALTVVAIIKLKEGYPNLGKMVSKNPNFFFVPTGYHKYYAEKLAGGLGEILYCIGLKQLHFITLEPMADIILRNLIKPKKYPLVYPESAEDLLDMSESEEE